MCSHKNVSTWTGEVPQQLLALAGYAEDPGSIFRTNTPAHNHPEVQVWSMWAPGMCMVRKHAHRQNTHVRVNTFFRGYSRLNDGWRCFVLSLHSLSSIWRIFILKKSTKDITNLLQRWSSTWKTIASFIFSIKGLRMPARVFINESQHNLFYFSRFIAYLLQAGLSLLKTTGKHS